MKLPKIALCLFAAGAIAQPAQADDFATIAREVAGNYTPERQEAPDPLVWHTGHERFKGDCDDYATAMISRLEEAKLPLQAYIVTAREGRRTVQHVVVCSQDLCSDSIHERPHVKGEKFTRTAWRPARLVRK